MQTVEMIAREVQVFLSTVMSQSIIVNYFIKLGCLLIRKFSNLYGLKRLKCILKKKLNL